MNERYNATIMQIVIGALKELEKDNDVILLALAVSLRYQSRLAVPTRVSRVVKCSRAVEGR